MRGCRRRRCWRNGSGCRARSSSGLRLTRHGANSGAKALTVTGTMSIVGDSIYDSGLLRAGALPVMFDVTRVLSTIGTWGLNPGRSRPLKTTTRT